MKGTGGIVLLGAGIVFVIGAINGTWPCVWRALFNKEGCDGSGGRNKPGLPIHTPDVPEECETQGLNCPPGHPNAQSTAPMAIPAGFPGSGIQTEG